MSPARLPERLTLAEASATLNALQRAAAAQAGPHLLVDAGPLAHFDSSAVAVLLELRRDLQNQGRQLRVQNWPKRLQDLVVLYGVQELLPA